eukprot:1157821-Pelagomonas_calceolata.AAC.1
MHQTPTEGWRHAPQPDPPACPGLQRDRGAQQPDPPACPGLQRNAVRSGRARSPLGKAPASKCGHGQKKGMNGHGHKNGQLQQYMTCRQARACVCVYACVHQLPRQCRAFNNCDRTSKA